MLTLLAFWLLPACGTQEVVNGGDDRAADDTAGDTADTGGDSGTAELPAFVGDWMGLYQMFGEGPDGFDIPLCEGEMTATISDALVLTASATCVAPESQNPDMPPPPDLGVAGSGAVTDAGAVTATFTLAPKGAGSEFTVDGTGTVNELTLTVEGVGELPTPDEQPPIAVQAIANLDPVAEE